MKTPQIITELEKMSEELKVISLKEINETSKNFLSIKNYQVILNNGAIFNRQKLIKRGTNGDAVIIVPVDADGNAYVIIEPRVFTASGVSVEVPAGYIDDGETREDAARRELKEEIGCIPESLIELTSFYQDQGISGSYNTCFLALGCEEKMSQNLDGDEYIKYKKCKLNELYKLVDTGVINDAGGIIAINEAKKYLRHLKRRK